MKASQDTQEFIVCDFVRLRTYGQSTAIFLGRGPRYETTDLLTLSDLRSLIRAATEALEMAEGLKK